MVKMTGMTYDQKIITLCESRGWDQSDLWRALGRVSKTTVSNWWNGQSRPDMDTALAVARVLGVPLDYLADDDADEPPSPDPEPSQDEQLALNFYRDMKANEGSATAVLKVLAKMANEGVKAAQPARQLVYGNAPSRAGSGNGPAVATGDDPRAAKPVDDRAGSEGKQRYGRVVAGRDETEHHERLERERKRKVKPKGGPK